MFLVGNQMKYIILNSSHKTSGYGIGIKFDKDALAVAQNKYLTEIVTAYIVYDLNDRPKDPSNNFGFKNCLFGATNKVKVVMKKIMYIVDTE